jgi:DNA-binding HxlR family transcriptional regulator
MSKKLNKGLRQYQTEKAMESQISILKVLSYDEDLHQYGELKEKTRLSDATLSKQLKQLKEMNLIERKLDTESRKYPPPVYYRLNPVYANAFRGSGAFIDKHKKRDIEQEIKAKLSTANPLLILKDINDYSNLALLGILLYLKENRNVDEKITQYLLELLVWNPYRSYTQALVEKTLPRLDTIDIRQLVWEM